MVFFGGWKTVLRYIEEGGYRVRLSFSDFGVDRSVDWDFRLYARWFLVCERYMDAGVGLPNDFYNNRLEIERCNIWQSIRMFLF